jgi:hypothetical protein
MKVFKEFADHPFGSWVINGLAVMAFFIAFKMIVAAALPQNGAPGAVRAGVMSA